MGLSERLATPRVISGPKCTVGRLLDTIDSDDATAIREAIEKIRSIAPNIRKSRNEPYTARWLCDVLREEGYYIGDSTMSRHVSRRCSCGD